MSVRDFKRIPNKKPVPNLVDMLERMLKEAQEGNMTNMVFVAEMYDGKYTSGHSLERYPNYCGMLGMVEWVKGTLLHFIDDQSNDKGLY